MAENKTRPTQQSVDEFLATVPDVKKRQDCYTLIKLMQEVTGDKPVMWGDAIVGFGSYHYRYASGREGDAGLAGFSPRKQNLTIYFPSGFDQLGDLLAKLGKFKTSLVCLYVKRLEDIDLEVLKEMVRQSAEHMKATNEPGQV